MVSGRLRHARLTTLIGPGGVGKTSVALTVAHHDLDRWPEGAVFVDLVPARTADDVLRALADAIGVEGDASRSSAELGAHLADRSMLIVVDNCEHVIDAAAGLIDVALGCGGTWRILATSREPLGLGDEHLVPVEPLGAAAADCSSNGPAGSNRASRGTPRTRGSSTSAPASTGCPSRSSSPPGRCAGGASTELSRQLGDPAARCPPGPLGANPVTRR